MSAHEHAAAVLQAENAIRDALRRVLSEINSIISGHDLREISVTQEADLPEVVADLIRWGAPRPFSHDRDRYRYLCDAYAEANDPDLDAAEAVRDAEFNEPSSREWAA